MAVICHSAWTLVATLVGHSTSIMYVCDPGPNDWHIDRGHRRGSSDHDSCPQIDWLAAMLEGK